MAVQTRDVIFTFDNACNSKCCRWFSCCSSFDLEDDDPVYVTPRGNVKKFDFKRAPSANANAKQAMVNLQARLAEMAENQVQMQAILREIGQKVGLNLDRDVRILRTTDVRRIEAIALPILRAASPEPMALVRSEKSRDLRLEHSQAEWE